MLSVKTQHVQYKNQTVSTRCKFKNNNLTSCEFLKKLTLVAPASGIIRENWLQYIKDLILSWSEWSLT